MWLWDGNVCSSYCLGVVVWTPEICTFVCTFAAKTETRVVEILNNMLRIDLWSLSSKIWYLEVSCKTVLNLWDNFRLGKSFCQYDCAEMHHVDRVFHQSALSTAFPCFLQERFQSISSMVSIIMLPLLSLTRVRYSEKHKPSFNSGGGQRLEACLWAAAALSPCAITAAVRSMTTM